MLLWSQWKESLDNLAGSTTETLTFGLVIIFALWTVLFLLALMVIYFIFKLFFGCIFATRNVLNNGEPQAPQKIIIVKEEQHIGKPIEEIEDKPVKIDMEEKKESNAPKKSQQ